MRYAYKLVFRVSILLSAAMLSSQHAHAEFTKISDIPLTTSGNHHGLAFDGTNWHIAQPFANTFQIYNSSFMSIGGSSVSGILDMRGMAFNSASGTLFVADNGGTVFEVTYSGDILNSFLVTPTINALAYDPSTNSIWMATFNGTIENISTAGNVLSSFQTGLNWTGLAFDDFNNTLLALEDDDQLYEYKTDGTLIGQIISTDQILDNGQGLAYDSATGTLYVTTQFPGNVTVFQDPSRVPEPTILSLTLIAACGIALYRRGH